MEHLLAQSLNGIHLLFDNETIARILRTPTEEDKLFHHKNLAKIQDLFTRFLKNESLATKREFLATLDQESFEMLLRTYFHIVDNSIASESIRH
jgi:hypothetical protein